MSSHKSCLIACTVLFEVAEPSAVECVLKTLRLRSFLVLNRQHRTTPVTYMCEKTPVKLAVETRKHAWYCSYHQQHKNYACTDHSDQLEIE
jgi:hypothetical protein